MGGPLWFPLHCLLMHKMCSVFESQLFYDLDIQSPTTQWESCSLCVFMSCESTQGVTSTLRLLHSLSWQMVGDSHPKCWFTEFVLVSSLFGCDTAGGPESSPWKVSLEPLYQYDTPRIDFTAYVCRLTNYQGSSWIRIVLYPYGYLWLY